MSIIMDWSVNSDQREIYLIKLDKLSNERPKFMPKKGEKRKKN